MCVCVCTHIYPDITCKSNIIFALYLLFWRGTVCGLEAFRITKDGSVRDVIVTCFMLLSHKPQKPQCSLVIQPQTFISWYFTCSTNKDFLLHKHPATHLATCITRSQLFNYPSSLGFMQSLFPDFQSSVFTEFLSSKLGVFKWTWSQLKAGFKAGINQLISGDFRLCWVWLCFRTSGAPMCS